MAVPAIVTAILTSIGSMLGQVLVEAFSAIAGFFKFVNETRRAQKEKEKQQINAAGTFVAEQIIKDYNPHSINSFMDYSLFICLKN